MFSQKHFRGEAKAEMLDMISYLKSAFRKILNDIDWMDPTTKSRAFDKLEAMKRFIAYPDELTDETVVGEYHAGLVIDEDDFFGNQAREKHNCHPGRTEIEISSLRFASPIGTGSTSTRG